MARTAEDRLTATATGVAAVLLILVGILVEWRGLLNNDVGWLLHVAERVLAGATLYQDVIEINPPLIIWLNLPIAWLAQETHLPKVAVLRVVVLLLMLMCAVLVTVLASYTRTLSARKMLLLTILILVTFAFSYFGEREHLILAFMLPWFMVATSRMEDKALPIWAPVIVGLLLGLALCLKPHYMLAWLVPLGYIAWARRSNWMLRAPEQLIAIATMIAYVVLVVLVTPEYVELVRRLGAAYLDWVPATIPTLLSKPGGVTAIAILVIYALAGSRRRVTDILALGTMGFLIGAVLQRRGNDYHYYPAVGSGLLLLGLSVTRAPRARRVFGVSFGIIAGTLFVIACTMAFGPTSEEMRSYHEFRRAVGPVDTNTTVLSLAPRGGLPFQLVNHEQAKWALRYPFPIVPAMIYSRELDSPAPLLYHGRADRSPLEQWFVTAVLDDAERVRPSILLLHIPSKSVETRDLRVDFAAYFSVEPRFRALLSDYRYVGQAAGFRIYRRIAQTADRSPP